MVGVWEATPNSHPNPKSDPGPIPKEPHKGELIFHPLAQILEYPERYHGNSYLLTAPSREDSEVLFDSFREMEEQMALTDPTYEQKIITLQECQAALALASRDNAVLQASEDARAVTKTTVAFVALQV